MKFYQQLEGFIPHTLHTALTSSRVHAHMRACAKAPVPACNAGRPAGQNSCKLHPWDWHTRDWPLSWLRNATQHTALPSIGSDIDWIFSLLRSTVMCLRGSHTTSHWQANKPTETIDLACSEGRVPNFWTICTNIHVFFCYNIFIYHDNFISFHMFTYSLPHCSTLHTCYVLLHHACIHDPGQGRGGRTRCACNC